MKNRNLLKKINNHIEIQTNNMLIDKKQNNNVGYAYYSGYVQALKNVKGDLETPKYNLTKEDKSIISAFHKDTNNKNHTIALKRIFTLINNLETQ